MLSLPSDFVSKTQPDNILYSLSRAKHEKTFHFNDHFLYISVVSILILRKKKIPSKSPSLAFAASSEDDILS